MLDVLGPVTFAKTLGPPCMRALFLRYGFAKIHIDEKWSDYRSDWPGKNEVAGLLEMWLDY